MRSTTKANYLYTWDHFIRDTFGKKKIKDVKYSDVLFFYTDLITNKGLQVNTLESINTVLRPTFELAVRDDIIRRNPVDGAYAEVKKRNGGARKSRRALTVEQQREFIDYVAKNPFFFHWYPFLTGDKKMKNRFFRNAVLVLGSVILGLGFVSCKKESGGVKKIHVAHTNNFKPYDFINDHGASDGYEVAVLKEIDRLLPEYEFEYTPTSDDDLLIGVLQGKYDVGTKGIWI